MLKSTRRLPVLTKSLLFLWRPPIGTYICLDTNGPLYASVCTTDVYICAFLGNKISINNQLYSLVIAQRRHMALNILDNSSSGARLTKT